jgi:hypothetical protein
MTARGLLYNRFSSLSTSLRPLIAQLEQRIPTNGAELEPILADCHIAWVTTRQALMGGRVGEEITRLNPTRGELVDLTRAGCSYLKQTCMDEFNLFKQFFLSGEQMLYGFLETLCDHLYDHIRPRILHEPSLTVLQEVCTVLQALMVHDVDDDDDDSDEVLVFSPESPLAAHTLSLSPAHESGDYFGPFTSPGRSYRAGAPLTLMSTRQSRQSTSTITPAPRRYRRPLARLHTELLLKMVLQDTQTRLVFRAQALIQTDVQYYVPKTGDLDYPAKLGSSAGTKAVSKPENSVSLDDDYEDYDDRPALLSLPPPAEQETWYPPLRSTLWVLSCLYTYIDIAVFTDLAQEAVLTCRQSLTAASETMGAKAADSPAADAKLFLVRHLLILKEMTAGLDLGRARAREWAGVTDFLRSLLDNASSLLGYRSHTPRDFAPDVKTDLDRELKRACEDLIAQCTAAATAPLTSFLSQCTAFLSAGAGAGRELPAQSWASPQAVADVHAAFRTVAEDELRKWRAQLMLYLQDEETVRVLVPPAQAAIVDAYRQFHDLVRAEYDFSCAAALSTPSAVAAQLSEVR